LTVLGRRALRQEVRLHGDFDLAGNGAVHAVGFPESLKSIISKNSGGTNRRSGMDAIPGVNILRCFNKVPT
jgi:hypothetical protein